MAIQVAVEEARRYMLPGFLFHFGWITPEVVHTAHKHGLAVCVYDVNTDESAQKMLDAGVDAIMTDNPTWISTYILQH